MGSRADYGVEEVRAFVQGYMQLREAVTATPRRSWLLVRYVDLANAIRKAPLSPDQREAIGLCGLLGLTRDEAGRLIGVNEKTMDRRWLNATYTLTHWLNGGT